MKLTICVLLIGGLGLLLGVDAGTARLKDENDLTYLLNNEIGANVEVENYGLLSTIWWLIQIVLRTMRGVNCLIEWVLGIETAAEKFADEIQNCGGEVGSDVKALVDANAAIISTCKEIIELQRTVCKRQNDDEQVELAGVEVEDRSNVVCYVKSVTLFMKLIGEVNEAMELAQKIPTTGANASKCVNTAVSELTDYFTRSQIIILECIDSKKESC